MLAGKARRQRKLVAGNQLWITMLEHLYRGLSPVQIASTLARMTDPVRLSHEAIYTALYAMPRGKLGASLLDLLRRRHKARRPARGKNSRSRSIPDMTLIDQRPAEVADRLIPGHWEGDLIIGKGNLSQVGVLVERKTLFCVLVRLEDRKAPTVARAFGRILKRFERQMRLSMTFDQGSEMSKHKTLTKSTGVTVYFAHPHAPWERGICENINGLIRQYLPKSTDLSTFSQKQLDGIGWELNTDAEKHSTGKLPQNCSSQRAPSTSSSTGKMSARLLLHQAPLKSGKQTALHFPQRPLRQAINIQPGGNTDTRPFVRGQAYFLSCSGGRRLDRCVRRVGRGDIQL